MEGPLVMEIISPISAGRCQNGKIMSSYAATRQKNILFFCLTNYNLVVSKKYMVEIKQGSRSELRILRHLSNVLNQN